jgi:hypothetical protein
MKMRTDPERDGYTEVPDDLTNVNAWDILNMFCKNVNGLVYREFITKDIQSHEEWIKIWNNGYRLSREIMRRLEEWEELKKNE